MKESMKRRDSVAAESRRKAWGEGRRVQSERNDNRGALLTAIG